MKRKVSEFYQDVNKEEGQALCTRLDELYRKLRSPAMSERLNNRW
jgi:hypothetical protein